MNSHSQIMENYFKEHGHNSFMILPMFHLLKQDLKKHSKQYGQEFSQIVEDDNYFEKFFQNPRVISYYEKLFYHCSMAVVKKVYKEIGVPVIYRPQWVLSSLFNPDKTVSFFLIKKKNYTHFNEIEKAQLARNVVLEPLATFKLYLSNPVWQIQPYELCKRVIEMSTPMHLEDVFKQFQIEPKEKKLLLIESSRDGKKAMVDYLLKNGVRLSQKNLQKGKKFLQEQAEMYQYLVKIHQGFLEEKLLKRQTFEGMSGQKIKKSYKMNKL